MSQKYSGYTMMQQPQHRGHAFHQPVPLRPHDEASGAMDEEDEFLSLMKRGERSENRQLG